MLKIVAVTGVALTTLMIITPAFAQSQISNNQPVRGSLHEREVCIQNNMKDAYTSGRIDSTELAQFQRDFDGILVRENDFKTRTDGMTDSGREKIAKSLDVFEARLARHKNKSGIQTAADPLRSNR